MKKLIPGKWYRITEDNGKVYTGKYAGIRNDTILGEPVLYYLFNLREWRYKEHRYQGKPGDVLHLQKYGITSIRKLENMK